MVAALAGALAGRVYCLDGLGTRACSRRIANSTSIAINSRVARAHTIAGLTTADLPE